MQTFSVNITSLSYSGTNITFSVALNSGQYGFQLYDSVYGWYTCKSLLNVAASGTYTPTNVQTSFNGGSLIVVGDNIG